MVTDFDDAALLRYSRHILLTEIGIEGQTRLRQARVLVVGAGGLGCPAALYLAASGVGSLTLADGDAVDLTNLQRQILHHTQSLGQAKVHSAQASLVRANPACTVLALPERLAGARLAEQVAWADVVLDCSDNFATRQAINRACVQARKPLVSGAALRFEGQITVFDARQSASPCYACLFPEDAHSPDVPCAVMGVFAPLTGMIGAWQAAEALKLIIGAGDTLCGRLLLVDALSSTWRSIRIPRDPACPVCAATARAMPSSRTQPAP
jgi:molybdopterin/thiamine biosynthesis adenylyltransferase